MPLVVQTFNPQKGKSKRPLVYTYKPKRLGRRLIIILYYLSYVCVYLQIFNFWCSREQKFTRVGTDVVNNWLMMQVMLISLKAGGVGINLTAASNAFLLVSPSFSAITFSLYSLIFNMSLMPGTGLNGIG